jgi:NADPH:quinone reductase-like Zn-dependent oxidoreductase
MKYRRVIIPQHGGPEVLQVIQDDLEEPGRGQARLRVLAAGVAWADVMMRTGLYPGKLPSLPFTPGYDVAGVVDQVGGGSFASGGSRFKVGQPVAALTKFGGYAGYVCVPEANLVPAPPGLDPAQVACLPLNYITAYQSLHRLARVQPGERVLIHGAAGGVGTAFLQLGRLAGLELYGTASPQKHEVVRKLGGAPVDYSQVDFVDFIRERTGDGVDAVFDPIGGTHLRRSFSALRPGGRLVAYGERAIVGEGVYNPEQAKDQEEFIAAWKANPGDKSIRWYEMYDHFAEHPDWFQEDLEALLDLLARGAIEPIVARRFPLEEAASAHKLLEASAVAGKIVLIV